MNNAVSKVEAIKTIEELADTLGVNKELLLEISRTANKYYRPNKPQDKSDGTTRQTYRVLPTLKDIQEQIKNNFFYNVEYPVYLQGGIKDFQNRRDYIKSATIHSKNKLVIKEDIANFFPSIKAFHVFEMWTEFFGFSSEVAEVLTDLTTYKGFVPQGAKTSSYLANLVFWKEEPILESALQSEGLVYTRLTDDITISTNRMLTKQDRQEITELVYQMILGKGLKPKRRKRKIMTSGSQISIHNLNTNSGKPTLSKDERRKIRAAVKRCEIAATLGLAREEYEKLFDSVRGKVSMLMRLHPTQAEKFVERLEMIKPRIVYKDRD